jgi:hypothetical protein
MADEPAPGTEATQPEATQPEAPAAPEVPAIPAGMIIDSTTGQLRPMTFMEKARNVAGQAAVAAAKVSVEVGKETAKVGGAASAKAVATIRDPATKARAQSALRKAKRGFFTALERIDPKILADVVVKATSLQERANASLRERGSVYRIGEISIGASIPPSITFTIERIDDPNAADSSTLLAAAVAASPEAEATIVSLDGLAVERDELEALEDEA